MNTRINWRWRFIWWIRDNVTKTPPENMAPKWVGVIYYILFPLNWLYERQSNIKYDPLSGHFYIAGIKLSRYDIMKLKQDQNYEYKN